MPQNHRPERDGAGALVMSPTIGTQKSDLQGRGSSFRTEPCGLVSFAKQAGIETGDTADRVICESPSGKSRDRDLRRELAQQTEAEAAELCAKPSLGT